MAQKGLSAGYLIPMHTCWELAQRWYAGRAERDWQRPDARALFAELGLSGPFWELG